MAAPEKLSLLRTILRTIGLSEEAAEDIVDRILALLTPKPEAEQQDFPYALRDDFLSPAEQSFCRVLQGVVGGQWMICPKVALADLFFAKTGDARQNRICLNRIDRKHVDFLLCEPRTLRPKLALELDDRSHERPDRQARDAFVDGVFAAAQLPLVRVPTQRGYAAAELSLLLRPYLEPPPVSSPPSRPASPSPVPVPSAPEAIGSASDPVAPAPRCPKCGTEMVLRTARTGANQGGQFWGCRNFPKCRTIVDYSKGTDIQ